MIHFDISGLEGDLKELENKTTIPDFWNAGQESSKVLKQIINLKTKIENFKKVKLEFDNIYELNNLLKVEQDSELEEELIIGIKNLSKEIDRLEISTLLSDKYDSNNAIVTLHPGAGGTEAQDWVGMLYRMYTRWANDNGYKIEELDYLEGDEAGIKSVTFLVLR